MSRRTYSLFALVPLLAGCVPVTEPLGDAATAEPDKRLVGRWQRDNDPSDVYEIDVPAVTGNPKGLMRAVGGDKPDDLTNAFWFHLTTVGKHTYATIYLHPTEDAKFADFREEGAYAKWTKGDRRRYFVFRFVLDGDTLDVDSGSDKAVMTLMATEKFDKDAAGYYGTPAGWLAKYLEKTGPDTIFDGSSVDHRKRVAK
jgi:hypothetical protein